jgi:hypothetical protein
MKIFTNGKEVEYAVSPNGQFMEFTFTDQGNMLKTTPYADVFLAWMIQEEISKELNEQRENIRRRAHEKQTKLTAAWWRLGFRGTFNTEHYYKVLEAKNKK